MDKMTTRKHTMNSWQTLRVLGKGPRHLEWFSPWDKVKEWKYPYAKWFVNAK